MISRQAPEAPVLADEPGPPKRRKPIVVWIIGGLAVFWLLFGLAGGSFEGKLSKVQKNDNAAYLPATAPVAAATAAEASSVRAAGAMRETTVATSAPSRALRRNRSWAPAIARLMPPSSARVPCNHR